MPMVRGVRPEPRFVSNLSLPIVPADMLISQVIRRMHAEQLSFVLVVQAQPKALGKFLGKFLGLFTERDLLRHVAQGLPQGLPLVELAMPHRQPTLIAEVISTPAVTLDETSATDLALVADCLNHYQVFCIPVVNDQHQIVRVITPDIVREQHQALIAAKSSELERLNLQLQRRVLIQTEKLQQAHAFETTLKQISEQVRDSLDEHQVLQSAVEGLAKTLDLVNCNAALLNPGQQTSIVCYEHTNTLAASTGQVYAIDETPDIYAQLAKGMAFQFNSLRPNPNRGRVTMLACPIADDLQVLDSLWLIRPCHQWFRWQEVNLVQQVANQCAIALRQARLYQAAQSQVTDLQRLDRLKDELLSTVSHELRTPMASIQLATEMLAGELQAIPLPDETRAGLDGYVQMLKAQGDREISLIDNLLELAKLNSDAVTLSVATFHLQDCLPAFVRPFAERAQSQQQPFQVQIQPDLPALNTDQVYLESILAELLTNAGKYTPPGEEIMLWVEFEPIPHPTDGTESSWVSLSDHPASQPPASPKKSCKPKMPQLLIQVRNSGVEIPVAERDRIFEKFYRIPQPNPWQHSGTGLGLALVKQRVAALGGSIQVTGTQDYTLFTVQIPVTLCCL